MPIDISELREDHEKPNTPNIYFEKIKQANKQDKEWSENGELRARQEKILAKLQETFPTKESLVTYLTQVCLKQYIEQQEFARKRHFQPNEFNIRSKVVGELFEKLVGAENDVYDLYAEVKKTEPQPKDPIQKMKEDKFIDVFTNPEKYGFQQMEFFNIPDIPFIVTKEGDHMILRAVAEVKSSGLLNKRAYLQLLPSGIRKSLEFTVRRLNGLTQEDAYRRGLSGFGIGKEMYISNKFEQLVVMPRDIDTDNTERLIARKDLELDEFYDFKKILDGRHAGSPTTLINSSFNRTELSAMLNMVIADVERKFKESIPQKP